MKISNWYGLLLVVCILAAPRLFAQQRPITLKEAIHLAVENSGQLKISQAKMDEMLASLKQANEARLPEAGLTSAYIRLNSPNIDLKVKSNSSSGSTSSPGNVSSATYGLFNVC